MFPLWSLALGFLIGAAIGSFLNVVIYRLPRGMSLAQPPSHCPNCSHRLGPADLFPIFSFLLSGSKCRHCTTPISWRYFWVEVLTGSLWAGLWVQLLVNGWNPVLFVGLALFASALVAAIFIDLFHFIIPDSLNAFLLFVGLGYNVWQILSGSSGAWINVGGVNIPGSIVGALVGVGVLWGIALFGRVLLGQDAMGHGDIKLARGIGAMLLPQGALMSFGVAIAAGAFFGGIAFLINRQKAGSKEKTEVEGEGELGLEEPESVGSLVKCGLGYALAIDVLGLFSPKIEQKWFGDAPQSEESEEDDWQPGITTIPFGPSLALGALVVCFFESPLRHWVEVYWKWATGG